MTSLAQAIGIEGRVPPHDLDTEGAVLSAVMLQPEALDEVLDFLRPDDFYSNAHHRIFEAALELRGRNEPIDVVQIATWLKDHNRIAEIGGMEYLAAILNQAPAIANVAAYGRKVRNHSRLRKLAQLTMRATARIYAEPDVDIISELARDVSDLADEREDQGAVSILEALKVAFQQVKAAVEAGGISGLTTGVTDLDEILTGLHDSDMYVFAGRPGMGKSALAFGALKHVCATDPTAGGAGFSLEMPYDQIALRLACEEANVPLSLARSGKIASNEWAALLNVATDLARMKEQLYLDSRPGVSIAQIRATVRRLQRKMERSTVLVDGKPTPRRLRIVVVDYIQLARAPEAQSREQEVSEVSRGLKEIAKEFQVPVLALAQLNRKCEERSDKRPMLSDLRDSGSIEQDADVVGFIYRDEKYNRTSPDKGIAEIIVAKQRNGPEGTVYAQFNGRTTAFRNLDRDTVAILQQRHEGRAQ